MRSSSLEGLTLATALYLLPEQTPSVTCMFSLVQHLPQAHLTTRGCRGHHCFELPRSFGELRGEFLTVRHTRLDEVLIPVLEPLQLLQLLADRTRDEVNLDDAPRIGRHNGLQQNAHTDRRKTGDAFLYVKASCVDRPSQLEQRAPFVLSNAVGTVALRNVRKPREGENVKAIPHPLPLAHTRLALVAGCVAPITTVVYWVVSEPHDR
jgi:hypothetical protein